MDNVTMILSGLVGVAMLMLVAPSILRMNQGKILRNIALWLLIFFGLALVYQTVGPEKLGGPQLRQPASVTTEPASTAETGFNPAEDGRSLDLPAGDDSPQGYNPPSEN